MSLDIQAYRSYFRAVRAAARPGRFRSLDLLSARLIANRLHPERSISPPWLGVLPNTGARNDAALWRRFLFLDSYAMLQYYRLRDFLSSDSIIISDPDGRIDLHKAEGGLLLTYHHHFFNHLGPLFGYLGIPTSVLTLSYSESPLYPLYEEYIRAPTEAAEDLLLGGRWIFVRSDPNTHSSGARHEVMTALAQRQSIVMAIDFRNPFTWGKTAPMAVAGISMPAPVGLLHRVASAAFPVSIAYLRYKRRGMLELMVREFRYSVDDLESTIGRYAAQLEALVVADPAFWEGWRDLIGGR
ncbi:hypothetical protein [Thiomonas sp.]